MRRWRRTSLVCVYRSTNATYVEGLVHEILAVGGEAHLWALDEPHPSLMPWTRGVGPGQRLALLNRLILHAQHGGWLVVADDDITLAQGGLKELLKLARRARLGLGQPAHAHGSFASHQVSMAIPGNVVRLTRFVEVGPLIVVAPALRPVITPFPEEYGMGWGLDVVWSDLVADGHRLGIVDRVTVVHHGAVGLAYDSDDARASLNRELERRGLADMEHLNDAVAVWRVRGRFDPRNWVPIWRPLPGGA